MTQAESKTRKPVPRFCEFCGTNYAHLERQTDASCCDDRDVADANTARNYPERPAESGAMECWTCGTWENKYYSDGTLLSVVRKPVPATPDCRPQIHDVRPVRRETR